MHGGVFQIKVHVVTMHGGVFQIKVSCTLCMVESFKLKSLYTMHGGVFQIKVPVHNAWWSISN